MQRVIVHEDSTTSSSRGWSPAVEKLKHGDPLDPDTDVSSLIDEERGGAGGGLGAGGRWTWAPGWRPAGRTSDGVPPRVLIDVTHEMKVCSQEIFGPVVSVVKARDLCHAIEIANDSDYGLQAGVFTNDLNKALYAARHLEVGGVMINEVPTFRVDHMPYGGVKGSGIGREGVKYAIQEMTELKMVAIREIEWGSPGSPLRRLPARRHVSDVTRRDGRAHTDARERLLRTPRRLPAAVRHGPLQHALHVLHAGRRRAPRSHDDILSYEELGGLHRVAVAAGISKVRITGGEPLVRKGWPALSRSLPPCRASPTSR